MSFLENPRFPDCISYGSTGGPGFNTNVAPLLSGYETRNQNWLESRATYNAAFGVTTEALLNELIEYFQVMRGKLHGFRFKDWGDYKSCGLTETVAQDDQSLGSGDIGGTTAFQILKTYQVGIMSISKEITKPIAGTLLVEVAGVLQSEGGDYSVDYTTGLITFVSAPGDGEEVRCGYEYDIPCRFDTDQLNTNFEAYASHALNIPIIEIRI